MLEVVFAVIFTVFCLGGGIAALRTGRVPATRHAEVEGLPARVIGVLLLAAIPLAVGAYLLHRPILSAFGQEPGQGSALPVLVACAPLLGCPLLAVGIGLASAKRVRRPTSDRARPVREAPTQPVTPQAVGAGAGTVVPSCPRCKHPAGRAPTVCTQCGCTVPAGPEGQAPVSLTRLLLLALPVALVVILLFLVLVYGGAAGGPAR